MAEQADTTRTTTIAFKGQEDVSQVVTRMKEKIRKEIADINKEKIALADPDVRKLTEQLKSIKTSGGKGGLFGSLKGAAGEGSDLGQIGKLLKGGGALAGFAAVGSVLSDVTAQAIQLKQEFKGDEVGAAQIALRLGESLPVLGQFFSAGKNIRELFTGELADFERIKQQSDLLNESLSVQKELAKQGKEEYRQILKLTEGINEQIKERALNDPEKTISAATFNAKQQIEDLTKSTKDQIEGLNEKASPTIAKLAAQITAAGKRITDAKTAYDTFAPYSDDPTKGNYSQAMAKREAFRRLKDAELEAATLSNRLRQEKRTLAEQIENLEKGQVDAIKAINADADDQASRARREYEDKEIASQKAYQDKREKLAAEHSDRMASIMASITGAAMRAKGPAWQVSADFEGFSQQRTAALAQIDARARDNRPGGGGLLHLGDWLKDRFVNDAAEQIGAYGLQQSQERQRLREERDRNAKPFWDAVGGFLDRTVGQSFNRNFRFGSGLEWRENRSGGGLPQYQAAGETSGAAAAARERFMFDPLIEETRRQRKAAEDTRGYFINRFVKDLGETLRTELSSIFGNTYSGAQQ